MSSIVGNLIVLAVVGLIVAYAIRAMYRKHKSGGCCGGDCCNCKKH